MAFQTLIDQQTVERRVAEMGAELSRDLAGHEIILLCVLKGGVFFLADLARAMTVDVAVDFIQVSSYGNQTYSSGVVTILTEPQLAMHGTAVVIV